MKDAALTYRLVLKTTAFAPHLLKEHNYTNINIKNILAKPALDRLYCAVSITSVVFSFIHTIIPVQAWIWKFCGQSSDALRLNCAQKIG